MGLFGDEEKSARDEVRVNVPEEESKTGGSNRLESEVESKVSESRENVGNNRGATGSEELDLEQIYRQNEKIIELLKQIKGSENARSSVSKDNGAENAGSNVNKDVGSGMDELL